MAFCSLQPSPYYFHVLQMRSAVLYYNIFHWEVHKYNYLTHKYHLQACILVEAKAEPHALAITNHENISPNTYMHLTNEV